MALFKKILKRQFELIFIFVWKSFYLLCKKNKRKKRLKFSLPTLQIASNKNYMYFVHFNNLILNMTQTRLDMFYSILLFTVFFFYIEIIMRQNWLFNDYENFFFQNERLNSYILKKIVKCKEREHFNLVCYICRVSKLGFYQNYCGIVLFSSGLQVNDKSLFTVEWIFCFVLF